MFADDARNDNARYRPRWQDMIITSVFRQERVVSKRHCRTNDTVRVEYRLKEFKSKDGSPILSSKDQEKWIEDYLFFVNEPLATMLSQVPVLEQARPTRSNPQDVMWSKTSIYRISEPSRGFGNN